jgi:hypothetical protein
MQNTKLFIFGLSSILFALGFWFLQNLAMYALSHQYREVGYIEYGSFLRVSGIIPQLGIVLVPVVSSVLIFLWYGKYAHRTLTTREDRVLVWLLLIVLFVVLVIRTAIISIQGYALIFI